MTGHCDDGPHFPFFTVFKNASTCATPPGDAAVLQADGAAGVGGGKRVLPEDEDVGGRAAVGAPSMK